jgi:hypothetical protein
MLHKIYKQSVERFNKEFVTDVKNIDGGLAYSELRFGEQTDVDELKDFLKSHTIELIEAEISYMKEQKLCTVFGMEGIKSLDDYNAGRQEELDHTISHLQQELEAIKNEK